MVNEVLTVAMLVVMAIGVFSGFPVALVLAGTGFLGFAAAVWVGITDFQHLGLIYLRARGVLTNESVQFTSVPMLIFLGLILNVSGVAETMFRLLGRLLTAVPGRYAIATLLIGLVLAPAAGVIGASVITVALVAYAPMMASGYAPRTAGAAVAASGALGVVFPPAVMLFFISNVFYLRIGLMYVALIVPVLLMVMAFAIYFAVTLRKTVEVPLDAPQNQSCVRPFVRTRFSRCYRIHSAQHYSGLCNTHGGGWRRGVWRSVGRAGAKALVFLVAELCHGADKYHDVDGLLHCTGRIGLLAEFPPCWWTRRHLRLDIRIRSLPMGIIGDAPWCGHRPWVCF